MSSIVLEPGVKDMLLADCKDFLHSEDWCVVSRPWNRKYKLKLTSARLGMPREVRDVTCGYEAPVDLTMN